MMSADDRDFVEVAAMPSGTVLIALRNGNFLVSRYPKTSFPAPFLSASGAPSVRSTKALLNAAIYAALKEQDARNDRRAELTLPGVILNLIGSYHTTHATPRLLRVAADRARALGRHALADFLERKIREEGGHFRLALQDLRALGLPAERLVAAIRPSMVAELIDYFEAAARTADPVTTVGYGYALERNALFVCEEYIAAVQALCPPGVDATRCLRVHSGIGSDASHVAEMVEFIASLPPDERLTVLRAAYETMTIIAAPRKEDCLTDQEINSMLREAACAANRHTAALM